jgi:hypothetical protein
MRWDAQLGRLFEDLEQQAEGLAIAERDVEVAEQSRAEYARVDLAGRWQASVGHRLLLDVCGVGALDGTLVRVGAGWCLVHVGTAEWVVRGKAVGAVRGLSDRAVVEQARPVTAWLSLASALRAVAESREEVVAHRLDGALARGSLVRVGGDFVDLRVAEDRPGPLETVPFAALAAVRSV